MSKNKEEMFRRKKFKFFAALILFVGIYLVAAYVTQFKLYDSVKSFPKATKWIVHNLVPDKKAMERLPKIINRTWETVLVSVAVTVLAAIVAFVFSLFGSKTMKVNGFINRIVRIVAAFFRNVPDVVWAMLLMFSFGQNILTGFFALFFTTFGLLTRAFIESIDEVSASCVEALDATGATFGQIVFQV